MFSNTIFEAFILRRGFWTQNYDLFDQPNNKFGAKLAQFNEIISPFSWVRNARFELRGSNGVLCRARMPSLGTNGTHIEVHRIDASPRPLENEEDAGTKLVQKFVWRMTTEIDFFTPWRVTRLKEQIGRMDVEVDGTTRRDFRLEEKKSKDGTVSKEWRQSDTHKVERWRGALLPMGTAAATVASWLPITMTPRSAGCTLWNTEAFSARVVHNCCSRDWSKLKVPPGQHIPMGLLAGQICSRILSPWNIGYNLTVPSDAPVVSLRVWDDSWHARTRQWAVDKGLPAEGNRREISTGGDFGDYSEELAEAFRPVKPRPGVCEFDGRYPDYKPPLHIEHSSLATCIFFACVAPCLAPFLVLCL